MFRVGPGLGLALGPCQRTKGFCCPKMISMKKGNIQVSSCHSLASFLTVGKYLDLGFRLSIIGPRLSALGFRFSALVFRLLALGSGFQLFSGGWPSLTENKGFLLFPDDFCAFLLSPMI